MLNTIKCAVDALLLLPSTKCLTPGNSLKCGYTQLQNGSKAQGEKK